MNKLVIIIAASTFLFNAPSFANSDTIEYINTIEPDHSVKLSFKHIFLESLSGTGCGILLGFTGLAAGYYITKDNSIGGGLSGAIVGGSIGYTGGNTLGVALVGNKYNEKGSIILSYLGSAGFLVLGILAQNAIWRNSKGISIGELTLVFPIIGSSLGYQFGRLINKNKTILF